ncbi:flagellar motor switch protein FliG [Sphingorhabdus pulchriflava]|nr:flagellar motor switch protein FliG [Sphingorhabdus pulchriflava]
MDSQVTIGGTSSAAILMLLLEENEASEVLRHLDPEEVRVLGSEMYNAAQADELTVASALGRFVDGSREVSALTPRADRKIRTVMSEALGPARADNLLAGISPQRSREILTMLRWMEVEALSTLLADEHPQVGAVILSALPSEMAAQVLVPIDNERQADLLFRTARLGSISAEAIEDIEAILAQVESARKPSSSFALGGQGDVAKIVNNLPRTVGEGVLRMMRKKDKQLAAAIEDEMFVFEDLNQLEAKSLGAVLRGVEAATLALALKGADSALSDRFLATMSARAAETIRDELTEMAPVKREEVEAARKAIVAIARAMAATGEIMLGGKSDDYV